MKFKISLSVQVVIALVLGVATGLLFGNKAAVFKPVGTVFILFLQAPVLLFMLCSIIVGLADLSVREIRKFALYGGIALLILLGLTIAVIHLLPLGFPFNTGAYFASPNAIKPPEPDFFETLIPANPFYAIANGIVPAVVIFGVLFSIALMAIPQRSGLIDNLRVTRDAAARIARTIAKFSPYGVYALAAFGAGTIPQDQPIELRFYYVAYCFGAAFISFVVLPGLVWVATGYSYRRFFMALQTPLLIAFTANAFVVLPLIADAVRDALKEQGLREDSEDYVDSLLPLAYVFPSSGGLFIILFVLFVGWFYNIPIHHLSHAKLMMAGVLESFTATSVAIPNLLGLMGLPYDAVDLYTPSTVLTVRLNRVIDVTAITAICFVVASFMKGLAQFSFKRLGTWILICLTIAIAYIYVSPLLFGRLPIKKPVFDTLTIPNPMPTKVYEQAAPQQQHRAPEVLNAIKERGILRVGYNTAVKPFAYFNDAHELVGYDIEMAHLLARIIGVTLEFVPLDYSRLVEDLESGVYDIAMSATTITPERLTRVAFSFPYFESNYAFLVRDEKSELFENLDIIAERTDLRLAYLKGTSWERKVKMDFPKAQLVPLDHLDDFARLGIADAMMWSADQGKTWALIHPAYTVVTPKPVLEREVYAYAVAPDQMRFLALINEWITLEKNGGTLDRLYNRWILGRVLTKSAESQSRKPQIPQPSWGS